MSGPAGGLTGRGFRLRWVLSSAVGMALAAALARPLSYLVGGAVYDVLGEVLGEAAIGAVAGGGVLGGIALAQWPLLRGRVPWAARWPAAGAAAGAAAAAAAFAALKGLTLLGFERAGVAAALLAGVAAFLGAHWLVLRRQVLRAGRIGVASAGGFLLAAVATAAVGALSGVEGASPLFGALFGAVYGAVTVIALGRLLRSTG